MMLRCYGSVNSAAKLNGNHNVRIATVYQQLEDVTIGYYP